MDNRNSPIAWRKSLMVVVCVALLLGGGVLVFWWSRPAPLPNTRPSPEKGVVGNGNVGATGETGGDPPVQKAATDVSVVLPYGASPDTPQIQLDFQRRGLDGRVVVCALARIEVLSFKPPWGCMYNLRGKTALRIAVGEKQQLMQLKVGQRYGFRRYKGFFVVPAVSKGEVKRIPIVLEDKPVAAGAAPKRVFKPGVYQSATFIKVAGFLSPEMPNLQAVAAMLDDRTVAFRGGKIPVLKCDLAVMGLEDALTGQSFVINRSREVRDTKIASWKKWWKANRAKSYDDIMRQFVDGALVKLKKGQDVDTCISTFDVHLGTDFAYDLRVSDGADKPSTVIAEIEAAWVRVRHEPARTWKDKLYKDRVRYEFMVGELLDAYMEKRREKDRLRQARLNKLKKEDPEVYRFKTEEWRKLNVDAAGRKKILQWLRANKVRCSKTCFADDFAKSLRKYEAALPGNRQ